MPRILGLWRPGSSLVFPPPRVFQDLEFGEDVEGLIDLPIQEMIRELRTRFPEFVEKAGLVEGAGALGRISVTWSWQWMRIEYADLTPDELAAFRELATQFHCGVFDADQSGWSHSA